jgi:hypothetical protein
VKMLLLLPASGLLISQEPESVGHHPQARRNTSLRMDLDVDCL